MTSPTKSCSLDPVPTFLLREFIDLLLPYVTVMVNVSSDMESVPGPEKKQKRNGDFTDALYATFQYAADTVQIQCESKNLPRGFLAFPPKRLAIFNPNFTLILYVSVYAGYTFLFNNLQL